MSLVPDPLQRIRLEDDDAIDWRGMMMAARERLWLVIVLPVIAAVLAWTYVQRTPQIYESRATLEVEDKQQILKMQEVSSAEMKDTATLNTVSAKVRSRTFLETVNEREKFHEKKGFFGISAPNRTYTPAEAVNVLAGCLKAAPRPETRLFDIFATHTDPEMARQIAQAAAEGLIRFGLAQRASASSIANDFLVQEAAKLRDNLEKSEMQLQQYRDENNAISLEKDQNLVVSELNSLGSKLGEARSARAQMETDLAALESMAGGDPKLLLNLDSISSHPLISSLNQSIASKKSELAVLSNRYMEKHPKHIAVKTELAQLNSQLDKAIPDVVSQLKATLENARTNEAKIAEALSKQEKKALELDRLAVQYNTRKRDVETNKTMYQAVIERIGEVDLTKGIESNNLKIHESANRGLVIWPSPNKIYSSAIGGALCVAFGIAFLLHFMDRTIKTVDQAEKALGLPVMAAVSIAPKGKTQTALAVAKEPQGHVAESFRSLRAMASLLGKDLERRTFLITSAVPSEGKTFCSSNYAVTLAQQGLRTLLIDADLRKPRISTAFFNEVRKPGLSDYLVGKSTLEDAAHITEVTNLHVMPAGSNAPNPAELLAGSGMKELIEEAKLHYDRIVIDSAPVIAVSDTLLIASLVETIFQVIKWGSTPTPVALRAIRMLSEAGRSPSGLILNQLPQNSQAYYYHYSPGYYGSKGVYGSTK